MAHNFTTFATSYLPGPSLCCIALILMCAQVRKATTCAQCVLEANSKNCSAVTEDHLDQLVFLMQESSARYSWYAPSPPPNHACADSPPSSCPYTV